MGPLDDPTFTRSEYHIPEGFFEESAEEVFKAAKNIADLVGMCRDKLPVSSLSVFAIWTAAFAGQYACHFPHMDQRRYMISDADRDEDAVEAKEDNMGFTGPTGLCYETLGRFAAFLKMASTYRKSL